MATTRRHYRASEVRADALVHALALVGALVSAAMLVRAAIATGAPTTVAATSLYAAALVAMPVASAAYHHAWDDAHRIRLQHIDQATIFLLIAGTYTPFALLAVGNGLGLALLAFVWAVALAGVALKLCRPMGLAGRVTVVPYLVLGWCGLVALPSLVANLEPTTLALLAGGGVLYTIGVAFHLAERLPYCNAIWHSFVVAAAACHVIAVLQLVSH